MEVRLTVIGCSPAWPNPGSAHSGYLLEADGCGRLLLDCGPGVLAHLREWELLPVDAIAITHFHLDHWGDLVPWCWLTASGLGPPARPGLVVPPGGRAALAQIASLWGHTETMFEAAFDVAEFGAGRGHEVAGFALDAFPVEHYDLEAYGFSVRSPAGRVLVYSGDTAPCESVRAAAEAADLFLCEATLPSAGSDASPRGHMAADEATGLAAGRRLILSHRPSELGVPDAVERAVDGLVVDI
jgi:ribonuclease BN (tRNA processing enzyme)